MKGTERELAGLYQEYETMLGDEIPSTVLKQSDAKLLNNQLEFTLKNFRGNDEVRLKIRYPSFKEESELARIYAEKYNAILFDENSNLKTRKQLHDIYKQREIWTDKDEEEIKSLQDDLTEIALKVGNLKVFSDPNNPQAVKDILNWRSQFNNIKRKITEKQTYRRNLFAQSIEGFLEGEMTKHKMVMCVVNMEDKPIWNNVSELDNESDKENAMEITAIAVSFWMGLAQDIIRSSPVVDNTQGGENQEISEVNKVAE